LEVPGGSSLRGLENRSAARSRNRATRCISATLEGELGEAQRALEMRRVGQPAWVRVLLLPPEGKFAVGRTLPRKQQDRETDCGASPLPSSTLEEKSAKRGRCLLSTWAGKPTGAQILFLPPLFCLQILHST
jgi:hypothetical protein